MLCAQCTQILIVGDQECVLRHNYGKCKWVSNYLKLQITEILDMRFIRKRFHTWLYVYHSIVCSISRLLMKRSMLKGKQVGRQAKPAVALYQWSQIVPKWGQIWQIRVRRLVSPGSSWVRMQWSIQMSKCICFVEFDPIQCEFGSPSTDSIDWSFYRTCQVDWICMRWS